jgi:hypothetical protein
MEDDGLGACIAEVDQMVEAEYRLARERLPDWQREEHVYVPPASEFPGLALHASTQMTSFHEMGFACQKAAVLHCVNRTELYGEDRFLLDEYMDAEFVASVRLRIKEKLNELVRDAKDRDDLDKILRLSKASPGVPGYVPISFTTEVPNPLYHHSTIGAAVVRRDSMASFELERIKTAVSELYENGWPVELILRMIKPN